MPQPKKSVSAKARKATGGGAGIRTGSYPITSPGQAISAVRLRGQNKGGGGKAAVLNKVSRSRFGKNPAVKKAVANARKVDAKKSGKK